MKSFAFKIPVSIYLLSLLCLVAGITSCLRDDEEPTGSSEYGTSKFTEDELRAFEGILNLEERLFNYANITIPDFFKDSDGSLDYQDNTPENNPITDAGATLGRVLFYDKLLSKNHTISCASCHQQDKGFSDPEQFSIGFNGEKTERHSMTLINSRWYESGAFFWDERASSLEEQVLMPIKDHVEMGMELAELVARLDSHAYYQVLFTKAFGKNKVTANKIARALSQFTRSIVSLDSKFIKAIEDANIDEVSPNEMRKLPMLSKQENEGLDVFYNYATCGYCHMGPALVSDGLKNNGLDLNYADKGKAQWTKNARDNAFFKAPSLAYIELSAPYMHDGRFQTLEEVVDHYNNGIKSHPNLNFRLTEEDRDGVLGGTPLKLELTQKQKDALIAFLKTCTDNKLSHAEKYSDPFAK